jgi:hypothetical protein
MSIDFEHETIITLGEACKAFPPKGVSTATLARWIQRGINGVKLETIVIGYRRLTSREAIQRFIAAQNTGDRVAPTITAEQRHRQAMAALHELERAGI